MKFRYRPEHFGTYANDPGEQTEDPLEIWVSPQAASDQANALLEAHEKTLPKINLKKTDDGEYFQIFQGWNTTALLWGIEEIIGTLEQKTLAEAVVKLEAESKMFERLHLDVCAENVKLTEDNEKLKKHFDNCNSDKIVTQSQALKEAEEIMRFYANLQNWMGIINRAAMDSGKQAFKWLYKHGTKNANE